MTLSLSLQIAKLKAAGYLVATDYFGIDATGTEDVAVPFFDLCEVATALGGAHIIFPPGTYLIDYDTTIPQDVTVVMQEGAVFNISSGISLEIDGGIEAGLYQIFKGAGTVTGLPKVKEVYPEWWGGGLIRIPG